MINLEKIIESVILSRALYVGCSLNIAEVLDNKSYSINELSKLLECDTDALHRLMRYLVANGVFAINSEDKYLHSDFSAAMSSSHPNTVKPFLLHEDETRWNSMGNLEFSIKTGKPSFNNLYGTDYFSYLKNNRLLSDRFNNAMRVISEKEEEVIAKNISFTGTIVDIGGGTGQLINKINIYNDVKKSYLFDLPEVKQEFTAINCTKISGSFFDDLNIDIETNTYILKRILHDWDDEKALLILTNVARSMSPGAKLLIFEGIIGENNSKFLSAIDLLLLSIFGGKERTINEFKVLINNAGLKVNNIRRLTDTMACIECIKITK